MSRRTVRIGAQLLEELSRLLREEVTDPRIRLVTLTRIDVSPDLRNALVYVMVMPPEKREDSLAGLSRAVPFLRKSLARHAGLRFTPRLKFVYDDAFESGQRVEELLRDLRDDDAAEQDVEAD